MGSYAARVRALRVMGASMLGVQTTIRRPVATSGTGVHTGQQATVVFRPAPPDSGIVFERTMPDGDVVSLRAVAGQVGFTDFCTVLGTPMGRAVMTVEHLIAAIYASEIDNLVVEIDGPEVPIMDGSAAVFCEALERAGVEYQCAKRRFIRVAKPVRVELGGSWAEFVPHDGTRYEVTIDFPSPVIGRQTYAANMSPATFRRELSRARTFGFMRDVESLWAAGFALGSCLENSVVIGDDDNVVNPEGLRYADEFVRHKALDAVGDLALAGAPFVGCYRSYRGGHKLNSKALLALLQDRSAYEMVEVSGAQGGSAAGFGDLVAISGAVRAPWTV